jgi:hypothetical protein
MPVLPTPFVQPARSALAVAGFIPRRGHWSAANAPGMAPIPGAWGLGRHIDTQSPWPRQPRLTLGVLCVSYAPNAPSVFGHALPGDLDTSLRQPESRAPGAGHGNDPNNPEKREQEKQDRAVGDGYGNRNRSVSVPVTVTVTVTVGSNLARFNASPCRSIVELRVTSAAGALLHRPRGIASPLLHRTIEQADFVA